MKLFLSSAGIQPETKDEFIKLLGKDPSKMTVAFIPTACDPEPDKSYVQWTIDQIKELGLSLFTIDLKDENEKSLSQKLSKADIICVNGGNAFYLLDWVKRSGFDKVVRKLIDDGKLYLGVSAGSYIACPTIEAAKWGCPGDTDVIGSEDLSALNLINFLIVAHYKKEHNEEVRNDTKMTNYPVVVLTDQQAIVVNGNKTKIVGAGEKFTLNNFKEENVQ